MKILSLLLFTLLPLLKCKGQIDSLMSNRWFIEVDKRDSILYSPFNLYSKNNIELEGELQILYSGYSNSFNFDYKENIPYAVNVIQDNEYFYKTSGILNIDSNINIIQFEDTISIKTSYRIIKLDKDSLILVNNSTLKLYRFYKDNFIRSYDDYLNYAFVEYIKEYDEDISVRLFAYYDTNKILKIECKYNNLSEQTILNIVYPFFNSKIKKYMIDNNLKLFFTYPLNIEGWLYYKKW